MTESCLSYQKEIPVTASYDVVVAGAGPAGWIAAISAARQGLRTALIERLGFVGGTATAGLVTPISGFYFQGHRVIGGISWEFVKRMEAAGAALIEFPRGHISFHPEYYKTCAQQMLQESGVSLYTNTCLSDVHMQGQQITHVILHSKSGTEALAARCFIDATGDGDLCHLAHAPMLGSDHELQPISLCFLLSGVDTSTDLLRDYIHHDGKEGRRSCNPQIRTFLNQQLQQGQISQFGGPWFNSLVRGDLLAVNVTRTCADACDRDAFATAEMQLRQDMFLITAALRSHYPEFAHCEIAASAVNAGIRETRHLKGLYTLTMEDMITGRIFDCPAAHCAHPIDIHAAGSSNQQLMPLTQDTFVPCQTMVTPAVDNLIAAGRCISAEREPYASLRVQGTLMSIGEAAGLMADLHCQTGRAMADLPWNELKAQIDARGFVL